MVKTDPTIYCFAIRAYRLHDGQIDTDELEQFLDETAGPNAWLMTSIWMFAEAPQIMRPGFVSVPVLCPKIAATRMNLTECEDHRPQRIFGEHIVGPAELHQWRCVAAQVYPRTNGLFPWELAA